MMRTVAQWRAAIRRDAAVQRQLNAGRDFPELGTEPELQRIVKDTPPDAVWQDLTQRLRQLLQQENNHRNLVGEGFESVLSPIIVRLGAVGQDEVAVRRLGDVHGFWRARASGKPHMVDLSVSPAGRQRTLVTVTWSIHVDHEEQFKTDYSDYTDAMSDNRPFAYVLVTNEFGPARPKQAGDERGGNARLFTHVVHINPEALRAAYGPVPKGSQAGVIVHVAQGRLIGLGTWLARLSA